MKSYDDLLTPCCEEIKRARKRAGLTQAKSAALVHAGLRTWQDWETGIRPMDLARWELFLIKTEKDAG